MKVRHLAYQYNSSGDTAFTDVTFDPKGRKFQVSSPKHTGLSQSHFPYANTGGNMLIADCVQASFDWFYAIIPFFSLLWYNLINSHSCGILAHEYSRTLFQKKNIIRMKSAPPPSALLTNFSFLQNFIVYTNTMIPAVYGTHWDVSGFSVRIVLQL